jgi:hypothetical protein
MLFSSLKNVYLLFMFLLRLAVFHVPAVHVDISHLDDQFVTDYGPVQWSRITAAFNYIDFIRGKFLAAILADHLVAFLVITEPGSITDITGIDGSPENAICTFEHKKGDHGPVISLNLEVMGFAIVDTGNRDFELTVGWGNQSAAFTC